MPHHTIRMVVVVVALACLAWVAADDFNTLPRTACTQGYAQASYDLSAASGGSNPNGVADFSVPCAGFGVAMKRITVPEGVTFLNVSFGSQFNLNCSLRRYTPVNNGIYELTFSKSVAIVAPDAGVYFIAMFATGCFGATSTPVHADVTLSMDQILNGNPPQNNNANSIPNQALSPQKDPVGSPLTMGAGLGGMAISWTTIDNTVCDLTFTIKVNSTVPRGRIVIRWNGLPYPVNASFQGPFRAGQAAVPNRIIYEDNFNTAGATVVITEFNPLPGRYLVGIHGAGPAIDGLTMSEVFYQAGNCPNMGGQAYHAPQGIGQFDVVPLETFNLERYTPLDLYADTYMLYQAGVKCRTKDIRFVLEMDCPVRVLIRAFAAPTNTSYDVDTGYSASHSFMFNPPDGLFYIGIHSLEDTSGYIMGTVDMMCPNDCGMNLQGYANDQTTSAFTTFGACNPATGKCTCNCQNIYSQSQVAYCTDEALGPDCMRIRCTDYSTCSECAADMGCSWCASTQRCMPGSPNSIVASQQHALLCPSGDIKYGTLGDSCPALNAWVTVEADVMPPARTLVRQSSCICNGMFYLFGGVEEDSPFDDTGYPNTSAIIHDFWAFDLETNTWTDLTATTGLSGITPRAGHVLLCMDDSMLVMHGGAAEGFSKDGDTEHGVTDVWTLEITSNAAVWVNRFPNCNIMDNNVAVCNCQYAGGYPRDDGCGVYPGHRAMPLAAIADGLVNHTAGMRCLLVMGGSVKPNNGNRTYYDDIWRFCFDSTASYASHGWTRDTFHVQNGKQYSSIAAVTSSTVLIYGGMTSIDTTASSLITYDSTTGTGSISFLTSAATGTPWFPGYRVESPMDVWVNKDAQGNGDAALVYTTIPLSGQAGYGLGAVSLFSSIDTGYWVGPAARLSHADGFIPVITHGPPCFTCAVHSVPNAQAGATRDLVHYGSSDLDDASQSITRRAGAINRLVRLSTGGDVPPGTFLHSMVTDGSSIFVYGGMREMKTALSGFFTWVDDEDPIDGSVVYEYTPSDNTWQAHRPTSGLYPGRLTNPYVLMSGGVLYMAGGQDNFGTFLSQTWKWTKVAGWTLMCDSCFPPMAGGCMVMKGTSLHAVGGFISGPDGQSIGGFNQMAYTFDGNSTWTPSQRKVWDDSIPINFLARCAINADSSKVYFFGGNFIQDKDKVKTLNPRSSAQSGLSTSSATSSANLYEYTVATTTLATLSTSTIVPRLLAGVAMVGDVLVISGGAFTNRDASMDVHMLKPSDGRGMSHPIVSGERQYFAATSVAIGATVYMYGGLDEKSNGVTPTNAMVRFDDGLQITTSPTEGPTQGGFLVNVTVTPAVNATAICIFDNTVEVDVLMTTITPQGTTYTCKSDAASPGAHNWTVAFTYVTDRATNILQYALRASTVDYVPCPSGTYSNTYDAPCIDCPRGTYTSVRGRSSCDACPTPLYQDQSGQDHCLVCTAGSARSDTGDACRPCDPGTISAADNATACTLCGTTSFQILAGQTECVACPANALAVTDNGVSSNTTVSTKCICNAQFWGDPCNGNTKACDGTCNACNTDTSSCPAGSERPAPLPGYWRDDSTGTYSMLRCTSADACPGGDSNTCGVGYSGRGCTTCVSGYYTLNNACYPCPADAQWRLVIAGIIVLIVFFVLLQVASSMGGRGARAFGSLGLAFNFVQVTAIFVSLKLNWPPEVMVLFQVFSILNLNIDVASPECTIQIAYQVKWAIMMFIPIAFFFLFIIGFGLYLIWHALCNRFPASCQSRRIFYFRPFRARNDEDRVHTRDTFIHAFLMFLSLAYVFVTAKSLEIFACASNTDGYSYLVANPSMRCNDAAWQQMVPYGILGGIVYGLGIPATFSFILWRVYPKYQYADFSTFKRRYGFLTSRYTRRWYYFEVSVLLRKVTVILATLLFTDLPMAQNVVALMILFLSLLAQIFARPFKSSKDDRLESILLVTDYLVLLTGLLFVSDQVSGTFRRGVTFFVVIIIALSLLSITVYMVLEFRTLVTTYKYRKLGNDPLCASIIENADDVMYEDAVIYLLDWLHSGPSEEDREIVTKMFDVLAQQARVAQANVEKKFLRRNVPLLVNDYVRDVPERAAFTTGFFQMLEARHDAHEASGVRHRRRAVAPEGAAWSHGSSVPMATIPTTTATAASSSRSSERLPSYSSLLPPRQASTVGAAPESAAAANSDPAVRGEARLSSNALKYARTPSSTDVMDEKPPRDEQ